MGGDTHGPGWQACQALTAPGRPHNLCQDHASAFRSGDLTVLVVADGVSKAKHPAEASDTAGRFAHQVATETRTTGWHTAEQVVATMQTMMRETSERFLTWAGKRIAPDGYQTTLAVAVAYADWLGLASVGDSFAVVCSGSDAYLAMEPDRPGNPNET
jgi:serine/threonine protein phosphatase PrpC